MSKRITNKNAIIVLLIVLLILLSIGYAVFADVLTISGTASASGTFGLEFQNEALVEETSVGVNKSSTKIETSADKKTLTITVADLAYPGAGAEFTVDIVNTGTIPAKVNKINVKNNLSGNDIIKIQGLEAISETHPTIQPQGTCNIHFIVVWPKDSNAVLTAENSTVRFDLEVEYVQDVGEKFEGTQKHEDVAPEEPNPGPQYPTIVSQISPADYGKSVDYSVTVNDVELNNWKLFYNDEEYVYMILGDYLPARAIPTGATGVKTTAGTYAITGDTNDEFISGLLNEDGWSVLVNNIEGAKAVGTSTLDLFKSSFLRKYNINLETDVCKDTILTNLISDGNSLDTVYAPHEGIVDGCYGYKLATASAETQGDYIYTVRWNSYNGCFISDVIVGNGMYSIRPVIKLPISITGQVGDTIKLEILQ